MAFMEFMETFGSSAGVIIALIFVSITFYFNNRLKTRELIATIITDNRNQNIHKIRELVASNLKSSNEVKTIVVSLFQNRSEMLKYQNNISAEKEVLMHQLNDNKQEYKQLKDEYYEKFYELQYNNNLLLLYIESLDPLQNCDEISEKIKEFCNDSSLKFDTLKNIDNNKSLWSFSKEYHGKQQKASEMIRTVAANYLNECMEKNYEETIGKSKYRAYKEGTLIERFKNRSSKK